ncbi:MAG: hypothetical protein QM479_01210 [Pseudomonadota bacterium]
MFTVFQIPIIDVRQYIPGNTARLNRPSWPIPEPESEFIRQFGIIKDRNRGGISTFAGEEIFCQARHAIQLDNKAGIIVEKQKLFYVFHNLFLRRFYFEGRSVAKLELGFNQSKRVGKVNRQESDWFKTISSFSEALCIVSPRNIHETVKCPLICAGEALSSLYLKSTTVKTKEILELQSWWISSGEPILLFEYKETKGGTWPSVCKKIPINLKGINLGYQRVNVPGKKLHIWYIEKSLNIKYKLSDIRNLRLHLLRFHAEIQSLKRVLRLISQKKIDIIRGDPSTELLQQYLQDTLTLISKKNRYGLNQKVILDVILNAYDMVSAGERISLLQKLSGIRKNILLKVEKITCVTDDSIYQQILTKIYDVGKQFERLPSTYSEKEEEHLRDHLLLTLEPNFEGSATGETFNKSGKTDILIRHEGNNVFIAELKFWRGKKSFLKTISQLLGYLTWRDYKVAVVMFVKNKDFSAVLEMVKESTPEHQNYLSYVSEQEEGWYHYRFHMDDDKNREVKLAIMLFHIPE